MPTITIGPGITLGVAGLTFQTLDPYFSYVTLLLSGDGVNGAQNNTFLDSSANNFSITRNGNPTQGTFSPYGDKWSNYFNGSGDRLNFGPINSTLQPGASNFTIEAFVNLSSYTNAVIASYQAANVTVAENIGYIFSVSATGQLNAQFAQSSGYYFVTSAANLIKLGTWAHVACVRSGNVFTLYVNGVAVASQTHAITINGQPNFYVGAYYNSGAPAYFNGYISNLRVLNTALYTSNFTPSTTPLTAVANTSLLTCQSNRFRDNSSNAFALTVVGAPSVQRQSPFAPTDAYSASVMGGSGYFDGSGDYLSVPSNAAFNFGTGDFTVEAWVYPTSTSGTRPIIEIRTTGGANGFALLSQSGATTLNVYTNGGFAGASSGSITTNQWNHVALTRSGNTWTYWINGTSSGSFTNSSTQSDGSTTGPKIAGSTTSGEIWVGYLSNVRIVKGTAVYTSAFTPSTTPPTAISGTSLLLNFTNAGITDTAMINDLETVGNAQISTSVKKYGSGSMYFDGSGDGLLIPASNTATFGTGDYTVEAWVQLTNNAGQYYPPVFALSTADNNASIPFAIFWGDNGYGYRLAVKFGSLGDQFISAYTQTSFLNTWRHIAVCRSGTTARVFVDGVQAASYTDSHNYSGAYRIRCGQNVNEYASFYLNGYIDDLRITRGYARYTSNFTPPGALS